MSLVSKESPEVSRFSGSCTAPAGGATAAALEAAASALSSSFIFIAGGGGGGGWFSNHSRTRAHVDLVKLAILKNKHGDYT